jgi:two-component system chemotaxis response regulator CheY
MDRTGRSILVVEDDADVREAVATLLDIEGYDVLQAADGDEALRQLRSRLGRVVLILLDLHMPRMDGRAFRAAQLSDPDLAAIPVVIMSGATNGAVAAAQLGARAYFKKPVSPADLLTVAVTYGDATPEPFAASTP